MGAPSFKDAVADDLGVFMDCNEFADRHNVNGKKMPVVIDDNELMERDKAKLLNAPVNGTYKARRLIYVCKADFGARPAMDSVLTLDGRQYRVRGATEEAGLLAIELEAVRS